MSHEDLASLDRSLPRREVVKKAVTDFVQLGRHDCCHRPFFVPHGRDMGIRWQKRLFQKFTEHILISF